MTLSERTVEARCLEVAAMLLRGLLVGAHPYTRERIGDALKLIEALAVESEETPAPRKEPFGEIPASVGVPDLIRCRKCGLTRSFGTEACVCGERSWSEASAPATRSVEEMIDDEIGRAEMRKSLQGSESEVRLRAILRLYREERRNFPKWYAGETGWAEVARQQNEAARARMERDTARRECDEARERIERAIKALSPSRGMVPTDIAIAILRGEGVAQRGIAGDET